MFDSFEIGEIFGGDDASRFRLRQGAVTAVNAGHTIDVTIGGSTVVVPGVRYAASVCPRVGAGVWLVTDGRDLFAFAAIAPAGPAFIRLRRPSNQTVTTNLSTALDFTSSPSDLVDQWGMFDAAHPTYVTAKVSGIYVATIGVRWASNATGVRQAVIAINGADATVDRKMAASAGSTYMSMTSHALKLTAGDMVAAMLYQTSGGDLIAEAATAESKFTMAYLGAA